MKTFLLIVTVMIVIAENAHSQDIIQYPVTKKTEVVDDYFGTKIADPYRWLEQDTAAEVIAWTQEQNKVTHEYLKKIPYRDKIQKRLEEIWNYPKYGSPFKRGDYYFFYKNDGLQNQFVLYYQKSLKDEPEIFLDPNTFSEDGTVSLGGISFSKDDKYMSYLISESGSDWKKMYVMEVATKKKLSDEIRWIKFSGASWKDDGFYYSRYDAPAKGAELSAKNEFQKVYYHKLGTGQSDDVLVYEDKEHPNRYFGAWVTQDQRYLILSSSEGTHGEEIHYMDLQAKDKTFKLLFKGFKYNYSVIDNLDDKFLVLTEHGAPMNQLILVDPANPDSVNWKVIIPEKENLLEWVSLTGNKLFAGYLIEANTKIFRHDLGGKLEYEMKLPGIGSAWGFSGKRNDMESFYTFSSFTTPPVIYRYDIKKNESTLFRKTEVKININDYETKQVFYPSKDGTKIPMFLVMKKGLKRDGKNPVFLYGFGGFNASMTPYFSTAKMVYLENGGIYAVANIRGGGEYGDAWHKAGMLEKKQNVFDDFIAAAEYLIKEKYTSKEKIAINGGSNGGLLVGACMVQRPDLFKVAIPEVGVLDMLRYHKFTIGHAWAVEYGRSDNEKHFNFLIKYSPLHNLKKDVSYPATLVMTADHDDRVVPAHSFKYIATLQEMHKGKNPVLIRVESKAGHGGGTPTKKRIEQYTDVWAFVFHNLGMTMK